MKQEWSYISVRQYRSEICLWYELVWGLPMIWMGYEWGIPKWFGWQSPQVCGRYNNIWSDHGIYLTYE